MRPCRLGILVGPILLAFFAPAAPAQQPEFLVDEAVFDFPPTLDPHRVFFPDWDRFFRCAYESPVTCDPDSDPLALVPRLLGELPALSEDGRVMTLKIRGGVRFHDDPCFPDGKGRQVTADDFVYMLMRHCDPRTKSLYWQPYLQGRIQGLDELRARAEAEGTLDPDSPVIGIEKVSGNELRLRFLAPYPQFTALLTMSWASILPREADRLYGSGMESRTVGTGPYVFDAAASRPELKVFRAARGYWNAAAGGAAGPLPRNDGLRFWILADPALHEKRFQDADLEILDIGSGSVERLLTPQGKPRQKTLPKGSQIRRSDRGWLNYLSFNTKNRFFADKRVRQAFALAIDREAYVRDHQKGLATIAQHIVPPSIPLLAPDPIPAWKYGRADLAAAKALLAAAGYPEGKGMPEFVLEIGGEDETARREVEAIGAALLKIGVKAQTRVQPFPDYMQRLREGKNELALHYWFADYPDAENFFSMLIASSIPRQDPAQDGPNVGYWANTEYDDLHRKSAVLPPGDARGRLYQRMIAILQEECPWIFLSHTQKLTLLQPGLEGLGSRQPFAIDYTRVRRAER